MRRGVENVIDGGVCRRDMGGAWMALVDLQSRWAARYASHCYYIIVYIYIYIYIYVCVCRSNGWWTVSRRVVDSATQRQDIECECCVCVALVLFDSLEVVAVVCSIWLIWWSAGRGIQAAGMWHRCCIFVCVCSRLWLCSWERSGVGWVYGGPTVQVTQYHCWRHS